MEKSVAPFFKRDVLAGAAGGAVDYVWDVLDAIASGSPIPPGLQFPDRKGGYAKSATTISENQVFINREDLKPKWFKKRIVNVIQDMLL